MGRENSREKQMPIRPRSVNSTFEKQNSRGGVGSNINASGVGGQNKILGKVAFTNFIIPEKLYSSLRDDPPIS